MAKKNTRSYELIFGVNSADVVARMSEIDSSLKSTDSHYKMLKKNLDQGWNVENWKKAKEISAKAVQDTAEKVETLKKRLAEMEATGGDAEKTKKAMEQLSRELVNAENQANAAKKRLQEINNLRMEQIKKSIQQVSDKLSSVGNKLTVGLTAPVVAAGAASVKMASDMDESINKVEVAFGAANRSVQEFSNTTLLTYGIAKSTALDMAGYFGDMATSMGFSQQAAADMATELVGLAGDLASFKNISLEEAQTALASIFTGETESLKKLGIVMTETNLNASSMAKSMGKTTQEMTQQEKTALRMQYVLENTKNAQGDFARTSDSTANQLRILTESLKELAAIAGQELIPMVTPIISKINQIIQSVGQLDEGTKSVITKIAVFAASFGPLLSVTGKMTGAVTTLMSAYTALKSAQAAATAGQTAMNAAMSANPAGAVAAAIGVLASALGSLAITSSLTEGAVESLGDKVDNAAKGFDDAAKSAAENALKQEAELKMVENLLPKYEELNKKTNKTSAEKAELKRAVDDINSVLPDSIKLLNEEKGIYAGLPDAIRDTVQARREEVKALQERSTVLAAIESQSKLLSESGHASIESIKKEIVDLEGETADVNASGLFDWISNKVFSKGQQEKIGTETRDKIRDLQELLSEYNKYQKVIDDYAKGGGSLSSGGDDKTKSWMQDLGGKSEKAYETDLKSYQAARKQLEHQHNMDQISDEQFYNGLVSISKKYLSSYAELQDERNKVEEEVYKYRKGLREAEIEAVKKAEEERRKAEKQAAEDLANAKKQALSDYEEFSNTVIAQAEKEANAKIAAIDAELAARDKLKAAQEKALRLEQAQAELVFTKDKDSRKELEQEIKRLQSEIKEDKIKADAESQKAAIQAEMDALRSQASAAMGQMRKQLTPEAINPLITQLAPNLTVNAPGLTVAQAQQLIMNAMKKIMYEF